MWSVSLALAAIIHQKCIQQTKQQCLMKRRIFTFVFRFGKILRFHLFSQLPNILMLELKSDCCYCIHMEVRCAATPLLVLYFDPLVVLDEKSENIWIILQQCWT